jgi:arginase family enzyme
MTYELNRHIKLVRDGEQLVLQLPLHGRSFPVHSPFLEIMSFLKTPKTEDALCEYMGEDLLNILREKHILIAASESFLHMGLIQRSPDQFTVFSELEELGKVSPPALCFVGMSACFGQENHPSPALGYRYFRKELKKIFKEALIGGTDYSFCNENTGIITAAKSIRFTDVGDIYFHKGLDNYHSYEQKIARVVREILQNKHIPLLAGGDHSNTYFILKAMAKRFEQINVVVFDAHSDCYEVNGGFGFVDNANVFNHVSRLPQLNRIFQIGVRKNKLLLSGEAFQCSKFTRISSYDLLTHNPAPESLFAGLEPGIPLYISCDTDVLDPSIAPEVSYPEPGGLSYHQLLRYFNYLKSAYHVIGYDFVELCPGNSSRNAAAGILARLICNITSQ